MSEAVQIADILHVVCDHFRVPPAQLKSPQRSAALLLPRHIAMYLSVKLSSRSLPQIGAAMLRDHTTILYGVRKIRATIEADAALRGTVEELEIAARAIARLRCEGVLPERPPVDPYALAEKVVRAGDRFVMGVSVEEIRALAEALLALRGEQGAPSDEEPQAQEDVQQDAQENAQQTSSPPMTPLALPPTLAEAAHDFLSAEAVYRRSPSLNVRAARDRAIAAMRAHARDASVAALLLAYDTLVKSEYSLAERDAQARYQAAVKALSNRFSELVRETQKETVDG